MPCSHAQGALAPVGMFDSSRETCKSTAGCRGRHDWTDDSDKVKSCLAITPGLILASQRQTGVSSILRSVMTIAYQP